MIGCNTPRLVSRSRLSCWASCLRRRERRSETRCYDLRRLLAGCSTSPQLTVATEQATAIGAALNDDMLNLDEAVSLTSGGATLYAGPVSRTVAVMARTLHERGDPKGVFCGEVSVDLPTDER